MTFALLAEAMVVIAWAANWQLSWWEWHVLMLGAFVIAQKQRAPKWHEERFNQLYLDETLAGADTSASSSRISQASSVLRAHRPAEVARMLNAYFERIIPLMERAGGEVHQIVGDELMVVFGKNDEPDCAVRAARASLLLQRAARKSAGGHDGPSPGSAWACRAARCTRAWSALRAGIASTGSWVTSSTSQRGCRPRRPSTAF